MQYKRGIWTRCRFPGYRAALITVTYTLEKQDLLAWYLYSFQQDWPKQRRRVLWSSMGVYGGIASVIAFQISYWPATIVCVVFALALIPLMPAYTKKRAEEILKKKTEEDDQKGIYGDYQLILSKAGMREIAPITDSLVKWDGIIGVTTQRDHIFVCLSDGRAAIVPRRSFSGPMPFDELPGVIQSFKEKTPPGMDSGLSPT